MTEIVEAEIGAARIARPRLERHRLGAGHVGTEAAQEHDRRRAPIGLGIGDRVAVGPLQPLHPTVRAHVVLPATSTNRPPTCLLPASSKSCPRSAAAAWYVPRSIPHRPSSPPAAQRSSPRLEATCCLI